MMPGRLPLAFLKPTISSPAFLPFDWPGNSVPPKEPPLLQMQSTSPKVLSNSSQEPDPT